MANYKPWLKMWVEWIDDPKMLSLALEEQAVWWRLCALAQKSAADGLLIKDSGERYTIEEILDIIRIKKSQRPIFDSMMQKMVKEKSLHWVDGTLVVTNFHKRQTAKPSDSPEAIRDRVSRYRQRRKVSSPNTPFSKEETLELELELEGELEQGRYVTPQKGVTSVAKNSHFSEKTPKKASKKSKDVTGKNVTGRYKRVTSKAKSDASIAKEIAEKTKEIAKKPYGEANNVFLTDEEMAKLRERFSDADDRINALSLYKGSKGKKYDSDYLTILNWDRMDKSVIRGVKDGTEQQEPRGTRTVEQQSAAREVRGFTVIESGGEEDADL